VGEQPPGLDLAALEGYLAATVAAFEAPLSAKLLHGGRSNLTYLLQAGAQRWVLRRPPLGGLTPSAHDMGREYRVVDALQDTAVPVAQTVLLCEDESVIGAPFSVESWVDGVVLPSIGDLDGVDQPELDGCARSLMGVLARLHSVDDRDVGLGEFGRPEGYLTRQVRRWRDQWRRVATRELADLDRLHTRWLPRNSATAWCSKAARHAAQWEG